MSKKLDLSSVSGGTNTNFRGIFKGDDGKEHLKFANISDGNDSDQFMVIVRPDGSKELVFTGIQK
ncbi:MAG TPA: hypothetical protein DEP20_00190 [Fusobacteria bacterium]|nr:hypothetical protein [Fusobacteriota bacterium]|tara:strand:+ start:5894 stop:6088 length:195 start_codon:yes stop_codon:yes gene_type:complete